MVVDSATFMQAVSQFVPASGPKRFPATEQGAKDNGGKVETPKPSPNLKPVSVEQGNVGLQPDSFSHARSMSTISASTATSESTVTEVTKKAVTPPSSIRVFTTPPQDDRETPASKTVRH
jgi:hypothetical protein